MVVWLIETILFILLFIVVVLIVMLFIPLKYTISGKKYDDIQLYVKISWIFNLINVVAYFKGGLKSKIDIIVLRHSIDIKDHNKKDKKSPKEEGKKHREKKKRIHSKEVLNKSMFKSIAILLNDFLRFLKPKKFILSGKLGFEDPYHAGMLCCFLYSFRRLLQDNGININSVFDIEVLEGNFEIEGKLIFAVLLFILIKFVLTKPVRTIIYYKIRRKSHAV